MPRPRSRIGLNLLRYGHVACFHPKNPGSPTHRFVSGHPPTMESPTPAMKGPRILRAGLVAHLSPTALVPGAAPLTQAHPHLRLQRALAEPN